MIKFREIVRWLTPYGVVSSYVEKNYHRRFNFVEAFKQYVANGETCEFVDDSPYESIVSVQGFGYSGSGAVVDLLREYDTTHVIGYVDDEGSVASKNIKCDEVDVLRLAGGLFEVEKYLGSNNVFQNDALLHRVVAQFDHSDLYRNNPAIRYYYYEYMSQICEVLTDSPSSQEYNSYLNHRGANDILFLKDMTIDEYRSLCRRFINSIFAVIKHSSKEKSFLVLDQLTNDFEFDVQRYLDYIPNLKIIMVYRDPRDVYTFAKKADVAWIPHKTVDMFIKWYRIVTKYFDAKEQNLYHVVQFENLVCDYDRIVAGIENYIGLQKSAHTKKGTCLDVSHSEKNLGIWRQFSMWDKDYIMIHQQLGFLCYNN